VARVEPPDVEHGNFEELLASFPEMDAQIRAFTG
jgi:hypothetical protein